MVHEFQSSEELYMSWYLQELQDHGYIENLDYQPKPFEICKPVTRAFKTHGKRKGWHEKQITLLHGSSYTADFAWFWTAKAEKIFFSPNKLFHFKEYPFIVNLREIEGAWRYFSVIDVKGTFDPNNNVRMFSMNQKIVYDKYGIYVQKIVPKPQVKVDTKTNPPTVKVQPAYALFLKSFTPQRYLLTDETQKPRKIQFETKSITDFVNEQRNKLEALSSSLQESHQG